MKDKKNIPLVICIILIAINAFLAFDLFGMRNYSEDHFEVSYITNLTHLEFTEDYVAVADDGTERCFTKGERITIDGLSGYDPEDNSPIVCEFISDLQGCRYYTIREDVYKDVSEEINREMKRKKAEAPKLASKLRREYNAKRYAWFIYEGEEITDIAGNHLTNIHGDFLTGLIAGVVVFLAEAVCLIIWHRKDKRILFVCLSIIVSHMLLFGFLLKDFSHLCR